MLFDTSVTENATKYTSKPNSKSKYTFTPEDMATAEFIWKLVQQLEPNHKQPNLESWANDVRLMHRDGADRTTEEVKSLFESANLGDFWGSKILSPANLRKHWNAVVIERERGTGNEMDKQ